MSAETQAEWMRAAFERWLQNVHLMAATWDDKRNCYTDSHVHLAWQAYREGCLTHGARWTPAVCAELLKLQRGGSRTVDLAKRFGVSPGRIGIAIAKASQLESVNNPMNDLSVRVWNALRAEGLHTVDEVMEAIDSGFIERVPNIGAISLMQLRRWRAALPGRK